MPPLVSICLPNLNNRRFLEERIDSIFRQSFTDWELIVSDNYSDDGAWEYFQSIAKVDERISIQQAPKEGMYANWNNTINRARGKYVYLATSDDNMPVNCIEQLLYALEAFPDCDIAHCPLKAIGENGESLDMSWYDSTPFPRSSGDLVREWHIRRAPFDGLLHSAGSSVYWSITQLLLRRSLFEKVGMFESQWGSMGDFNWNMRATLLANTVHVPTTWGGWRIHPSQATALCPKEPFREKMEDMINHAVAVTLPRTNSELRRNLKNWSLYVRERNSWWNTGGNRLQRMAYVIGLAFRGNLVALDYLKYRLRLGGKWLMQDHELARSWVEECGLRPAVFPVDPTCCISPTHKKQGDVR